MCVSEPGENVSVCRSSSVRGISQRPVHITSGDHSSRRFRSRVPAEWRTTIRPTEIAVINIVRPMLISRRATRVGSTLVGLPGRVVEVHREPVTERHLHAGVSRSVRGRRRNVPHRGEWRRPNRSNQHSRHRRLAKLVDRYEVRREPQRRNAGLAARRRCRRRRQQRRKLQLHSRHGAVGGLLRSSTPYSGTPCRSAGDRAGRELRQRR